MSTTFAVSPVEPSKKPLGNIATVAQALMVSRQMKGIIGAGASATQVIPLGFHPLLGAFHQAYADHYPLVLSPDDIWLAVLQGLATHVRLNAGTLRSRLVSHEGEKTVEVELPGYVHGDSPANDWPKAVRKVVTQMVQDGVPAEVRASLMPNFSTTGDMEEMVCGVALMDVLSPYLSYAMLTACGIPEVTLLGTPEDWKTLLAKVQGVASYDLEWWTEHLIPVIEQFVRASTNDVDLPFWQSAYKVNDDSGGPYVSGWVNILFPYVEIEGKGSGPKRSPYFDSWQKEAGHGGPTTRCFPAGQNVVPWTWNYYGKTLKMQFVAGFVGITQDPETLAVSPVQGWAVVDTAVEKVRFTAEEEIMTMKMVGFEDDIIDSVMERFKRRKKVLSGE